MNCLLPLMLLVVSFGVRAGCQSSIPLSGSISIESCDPNTAECRSAGAAMQEYVERIHDDPSEFTIALQASPWHLYDGEMRILTIEELAATIRPHAKPPVKRVKLIGSWTATAPEKSGRSHAEKLSAALDGFPVDGMDGFLWISNDGTLRTTRQAFTIRKAGRYGVRPGEDVMASLVTGWYGDAEAHFVEHRDAGGMLRVGTAWDLFYLCQEKALAAFEAAAKMSGPIAAYNAALLHLERNSEGDRDAAIALLSQATDLGDAKSKALLQELTRSEAVKKSRSQ